MATDSYNATVTGRIEVAPGLIILRVTPDNPLFPFEAGQYTVLGLKRKEPGAMAAEGTGPPGDPEKMIKRAYSIASSSRASQYAEFYLTLVSSGELTPRLFALGEGGRLFMGPKATGVFTLARIPEGRHALLVATGTGLAPYMSMLRSEIEKRRTSPIRRPPRRALLMGPGVPDRAQRSVSQPFQLDLLAGYFSRGR